MGRHSRGPLNAIPFNPTDSTILKWLRIELVRRSLLNSELGLFSIVGYWWAGDGIQEDLDAIVCNPIASTIGLNGVKLV
jgi:hypothetical protein